ncbi:MAG: alcohol dehydrogenase catalytic domain-containing protein [Desulfosarcinaceae bacterium]|nr:alcohol dehydrogenase catalytic domain-containing protein [Desulfosarcinaceae bacterium]
MKSAVLVAPNDITIKETPTPTTGPGEVLIQPTLAGVCGSDFALYRGKFGVPLPVIPGHEAVGRVAEVGEGVANVAPGQRVVVQPNFPCRTCPVCVGGNENVCPAKIRLGIDTDGVFAKYAAVPADFVWPLPDQLPDDAAVLIEPMAVALQALNLAAPRPGQRVLVLGCGVIGSLALQLALDRGARVTACDIVPEKLRLAEDLGADEAFVATNPPSGASHRFDRIIEASGAPDALAQATRLAAPAGHIVLLGLPGKDHPLALDPIVRKGLKIHGSMIYRNEFPVVIETLAQGRIRTGVLVSRRLALEELAAGLDDFTSPERIKMVVEL